MFFMGLCVHVRTQAMEEEKGVHHTARNMWHHTAALLFAGSSHTTRTLRSVMHLIPIQLKQTSSDQAC